MAILTNTVRVCQIDALIYSSYAPDFLTKFPELVPTGIYIIIIGIV